MEFCNKPLLTVLMVDGSFREHFHSLDYFCNQTISKNQFELIWVEFYNKVKNDLINKINHYNNARIIKLNKSGLYHSSFCFNAGIEASRGEIVIIADADVIVEKNFIETVYKEHLKDNKLAMYVYRYDEPSHLHKNVIDIDHLKTICKLTNTNNYGGCLTVRKKWLCKINGYEQHSVFSSGFHANGYDIYTRLKTLGLKILWHPELKLYHSWHPNAYINSQSHDIQKTISDYRAKNQEILAYQGIKTTFNTYIPLELKKLIDHHEYQSRTFYKYKRIFSYYFDKLKRIINIP